MTIIASKNRSVEADFERTVTARNRTAAVAQAQPQRVKTAHCVQIPRVIRVSEGLTGAAGVAQAQPQRVKTAHCVQTPRVIRVSQGLTGAAAVAQAQPQRV